MNYQKIKQEDDRKKAVVIYSLYAGTLIIIFLGAFFSAFSVLNDIYFQVLNSAVPGIVFGLLVAYLGIRYFFQVSNFKTEIYKNNDKFRWSNFKRKK